MHIPTISLLLLSLALFESSSAITATNQFVSPSAVSLPSDTVRFSVNYATALPSLAPAQWEKDYARYTRFLTPEIRRTQVGLSFTKDQVHTWWCQPSANPHAQLDTLTRVKDPAKLLGNWRNLVNRTVTHIDSFSVADQKFYRSASAHNLPNDVRLNMTEQKISLQTLTPKPEQLNSKYELVNQRYLLLYKNAKARGAVAQVGLDSAGHLLLHHCSVTERKVPGKYLTYQTVIRQSIFARE